MGSFKWKGVPLSAWLFRIAHNLMVDYHRRVASSRRYLEQAAELEPLLRTAVSGQRAMVIPKPSPTARSAGRQDMLTTPAARRKRPRRLFPIRGWALALVSLVIAVIVSSGTVMASFQSVPEETLYPLKMAVERIQLALSTSPVSQAHTLVRHSDNRLKEIEILEGKGKAQVAERLRERMKS